MENRDAHVAHRTKRQCIDNQVEEDVPKDGGSNNCSNTDQIFTNLKTWVCSCSGGQPNKCSNSGTTTTAITNTNTTNTSGENGYVHPAIQMTSDRTLIVTDNIPSNTLVMKIPVVTILSGSDTDLANRLSHHPIEVQAYLDSLPSPSQMNHLPRNWSIRDPSNAMSYLTGSPVLERVYEQQRNLQKEYYQIQQQETKSSSMKSTIDTSSSGSSTTMLLPSFAEYSYAMAIVTSRAFWNSWTQESVLVPLLDLCNHSRGRCRNSSDGKTTSNSGKKNLSYTFVQQKTDKIEERDASTTSTSSSLRLLTTTKSTTTKQNNNITMVHVTTSTELRNNDILRITYGAQGNAALLLNYGFTLPNNIEPDGSSNDTLEMGTNTNVFLRTGPKAYTYGCLVRALEIFYSPIQHQNLDQHHTPNISNISNNNEIDDVETFLNQCDEEENDNPTSIQSILGQNDDDDDDDDDDFPQNNLEFDDDLQPSHSDEAKRKELGALSAFQTYLLGIARGYKLTKDSIAKILQNASMESPERYAALLIRSELRIIQFFLYAITAIKLKLGAEQQTACPSLVHLELDDLNLIEQQIEELVSAYMRIRHPL